MVTHDEGWFQGYGSQRLYYQSWRGEDPAQAGMVIVHGAGDHSGRFDRIVQPVAQSGIAVFAFDLRGFGRSTGKKVISTPGKNTAPICVYLSMW